MPKVDGFSPRVVYTDDDVRIDMPTEDEPSAIDQDHFDRTARSPLSMEIEQKRLANAQALADEVERALHTVLLRHGAYEDVIACIMAYIISKTKDKIDRRTLEQGRFDSAEQERKAKISKIDSHVSGLVADTLAHQKLPVNKREEAADYIRKIWQQGRSLLDNDENLVEQAKKLENEVKQLTQDQNYMISALEHMLRLFQEASRRSATREA